MADQKLDYHVPHILSEFSPHLSKIDFISIVLFSDRCLIYDVYIDNIIIIMCALCILSPTLQLWYVEACTFDTSDDIYVFSLSVSFLLRYVKQTSVIYFILHNFCIEKFFGALKNVIR